MRFIERPRPEIEHVHTEKKEQAKSHKPRLELRSEALNLWVSHTPSFPGLQVTKCFGVSGQRERERTKTNCNGLHLPKRKPRS